MQIHHFVNRMPDHADAPCVHTLPDHAGAPCVHRLPDHADAPCGHRLPTRAQRSLPGGTRSQGLGVLLCHCGLGRVQPGSWRHTSLSNHSPAKVTSVKLLHVGGKVMHIHTHTHTHTHTCLRSNCVFPSTCTHIGFVLLPQPDGHVQSKSVTG